MNFQLQAAPEDYSSSAGSEPMPFVGAGATSVMGRGIQAFILHERFGYLGECPLPACRQLDEWVQIRTADTIDFKSKGVPAPECGPGIS